jgi:hypothetical protein
MKIKVEADISMTVTMEVEADDASDAKNKVEMITDISIAETDMDIVVTDVDILNNDITDVENMAEIKWDNNMDKKERIEFLTANCALSADDAYEMANKDGDELDPSILEEIEVD